MALGYMKPGLEATEHPTSFDIVLAAGWFEGEGSCNPNGKSGQVQIVQKDEWMILRLRSLFGGKISIQNCAGWGTHKPLFRWNITGARARGFLMTIYKFMSPRRKLQIRKALGVTV